MNKRPGQRRQKPKPLSSHRATTTTKEERIGSVRKITGQYYDPFFLTPRDYELMLKYFQTLKPIWEMRYSKSNPPPEGGENRRLLRPVYWLGNWQFACLDYYHPPKGLEHRCVRAEEYPEVIKRLVYQIENITREYFPERDIPKGWHLNTCLINFYGHQITPDGKKIDTGRVGEHKDFEPGPVGSISLGERALIQFVESTGKESTSKVAIEQWLDDGSLQIFAGDRLKKNLFHRVQRVDHKKGLNLPPEIEGFSTRRINLTFRYVPDEHIYDLSELPKEKVEDILPYITQLAKESKFFRDQLDRI